MDQRRQTIAAYLLVTVTTTSDAFPHPDLWSSRTQPQKPAHAAQEKLQRISRSGLGYVSRHHNAFSQYRGPSATALQRTAGRGRACHLRGPGDAGPDAGAEDPYAKDAC